MSVEDVMEKHIGVDWVEVVGSASRLALTGDLEEAGITTISSLTEFAPPTDPALQVYQDLQTPGELPCRSVHRN